MFQSAGVNCENLFVLEILRLGARKCLNFKVILLESESYTAVHGEGLDGRVKIHAEP